MRHNAQFQHIARLLMKRRLRELDTRAAAQPDSALTAEESAEREQLQELLSEAWRDCSECLGVGRVRFAYTGIIMRSGYVVSRVDEDQTGHTPQEVFGVFPSLDAAQGKADILNQHLGLDRKTAYGIVTSSLRAENIREQNSQRN
jgi:hypothetical protein